MRAAHSRRRGAATGLAPGSWRRAAAHGRWVAYALAGAVSAATVGPWLVLVLLGCGAIEASLRVRTLNLHAWPLLAAVAPSGLGWVALKVGALSYGGGFVIIPLMQHDAVET